MTSNCLESREYQEVTDGVSRYTPGNLNDDIHPYFSTGPSLSRRSFLKFTGAAAATVSLELMRRKLFPPKLENTSPVIPPESLQFDVPSDLRLIKVNPGDTLTGLVPNSGLKAGELMDMNGISDPRSLRAGEAIVVPRSLQTIDDREIISFEGLAFFQPVIARAIVSPDVLPKDDFVEWELEALNRFARDASLELPRLLGMGGAYRAGFFRILRPSEVEVDVMSGLGASGMVARTSAVCTVNPEEGDDRAVKASIGCGPNGLLRIYLLTRFSDSVFQSLEKESLGFGRLAYLDGMNYIIRHEMLHLYFGDLMIPPFDTHELIYALSDFGLTLESDRGFGNVSPENGFRNSQKFYRRDRMEWYLVRQYPDIIAKLYPWAQDRRARRVAISEMDVRTRLQDTEPTFSSWEEKYKRPLTVDSFPIEGRQIVWKKSSTDVQVYWYAPVWNVRWPNLNEKNKGWIDDLRERPKQANGVTLYRSWKLLGQSSHGVIPDFAKTTNAVAYQVPNGFTGQVPNPSYPSAKLVAWWK